MEVFYKIDRAIVACLSTGWLKPRNMHYLAASSGVWTTIFLFVGFIVGDLFPPLAPSWSAERTTKFYVDNQSGLHAASVLIMFSGATFLAYTVVISDQMRKIPNLPWFLPALQLASGTAASWTLFLPGLLLAIGAFRTDRDSKILELMNDAFWLITIMPLQPFLPMYWSWIYAMLIDTRERRFSPKPIAYFNLFVTVIFFFAMVVHVTKHGPFAWNGGLGFWTPLVLFGIQFLSDSYYLIKSVHADYREQDALAESLSSSVRIDDADNKV